MKRIFRPKPEVQAVFPAEKKGLYPKNVTKSGVSLLKTPILASICAPEALSLLISSGHSPRLGGNNFRLGGHKQSVGGTRPRYAPQWRLFWCNPLLLKFDFVVFSILTLKLLVLGLHLVMINLQQLLKSFAPFYSVTRDTQK